ncbi:MAG: patatin-like phospholipase family protein [Gammaproteobacteria bacterium]
MIFNHFIKVQDVVSPALPYQKVRRLVLSRTFLITLLCFYFIALTGCATSPPTPTAPSVVTPIVTPTVLLTPTKIPDHTPRVALVLGGGGARGYAHIGVLKVLQHAGIPIDLVVGSSIGSLVGALYADSANAYQVQKILLATQEQDLIDVHLLHVLSGAVSGARLQHFVTQHIKASDFKALKVHFVAVATDLRTGAIIRLPSGPIAPAINASCALPPAFHPVNLYGHILVDGGIADPVPVNVARLYNPHVVIAVNIAEQLSPEMPKSILGVSERSTLINLMRYARLSSQNADFVIQPQVGNIGAFDNSHKIALIAAGEVAARRALPQICQILAAKNINSRCATVLSSSYAN